MVVFQSFSEFLVSHVSHQKLEKEKEKDKFKLPFEHFQAHFIWKNFPAISDVFLLSFLLKVRNQSP